MKTKNTANFANDIATIKRAAQYAFATLALAALFVRTVTADCTEGRHVPYSAMA